MSPNIHSVAKGDASSPQGRKKSFSSLDPGSCMLGDPIREHRIQNFKDPDFTHLHSIGEAFLHHEIKGIHMMPDQLLQGLYQKEQSRADHRMDGEKRCNELPVPLAGSDRTLICSSLILP